MVELRGPGYALKLEFRMGDERTLYFVMSDGRGLFDYSLWLVAQSHSTRTQEKEWPESRRCGTRTMSERERSERESNGGAEGTRTPYLFHAMEALYQMSYSPAPDTRFARIGAGPAPCADSWWLAMNEE